jgi:hypothetical protein
MPHFPAPPDHQKDNAMSSLTTHEQIDDDHDHDHAGAIVGTRRGIPTLYGGIEFRSRLEAKWAAMFSALGWRWEYEPEDLAGYVPDFVVMRPGSEGPLLVEVKPAYDLAAMGAAARKIDASGWPATNAALIVGATWNPTTPGSDDAQVFPFLVAGALRQPTASGQHGAAGTAGVGAAAWAWAPALWAWCGSCSSTCLHASWACPHCGGGGSLGAPPDLKSMWNAAGNHVRWKGRAP